MVEEPSTAERRRPRRLRALSLVAAVVVVLITALPGTASATQYAITPLVNCYYQNADDSITVVIGYASTYPTTQTIPVGSRNHVTPSTYSAALPTVFKPGTNNGVATMRIAAADVYTTSWTLDGSTVSYVSAYGASTCTQAQLPAFANGAAIAAAVLVAGVAGALVVRRVRRVRNLPSAASSNRSAPGGHRA